MEISTFDSTTTYDAGWESTTASTKRVSGSFDFFYNIAIKPTGATANLTPGNLVVLTLYVNVAGGDTLTGNGLITKLSLKTKVKDGFMVTASFTSVGAWVLPS